MFNTLALNPAYAGTQGMLSAIISSRHQWVGFEDAPSTQTFSINTPLAKGSFGAGFTILHDKIGPVANTGLWLDYSYQLRISENSRLSMGLKGGFNHFQKDLTRFITEVGTEDASYSEPTETQVLPNFGFGLYNYSSKYYVGISIPRLVENNLIDKESVSSVFVPKENRLYLLMAGYALPLNDDFVLKPSFIVRATTAAPLSIDVNMSLLIRNRIWLGAMLRPQEAMGGLIQFKITDQLSLAYAYDTSIKKLTSNFGSSHEAMVTFNFDFKKSNVLNPRYF